MPSTSPAAQSLRAMLLLPALLLAGCDADPAELAREIAAARGECDEEALRAGTEECVQMFERYAEMGTEAMQTYIGAMKAFDQALQRMPPPHFDTAGLGRALTPGAAQGRPGAAGTEGLQPTGPSYYGARGGRSPDLRDGWMEHPSGPGAGYGDPRAYGGRTPYPYGGGASPGYAPDPYGYGDGYGAPPGWGPERGEWGRDPRYGADPRYETDPRYGPDPRYRDPGYMDPRLYRDPRYGAEPGYSDGDPRYGAEPPRAPGRGLLLPPEERLRRPWLLEEGYEERYGDPYLDPRYRPLPGAPYPEWYADSPYERSRRTAPEARRVR